MEIFIRTKNIKKKGYCIERIIFFKRKHFCHDSCLRRARLHVMHQFFRQIKRIVAILFLLHTTALVAQAPTGTDALWSELEEQIQKGNRRALRDLATFLDKPNYADATRRTLLRYTFFTKNEIDLSRATREEFLVFFYEQEERLKFSEILKAFYRTPVEIQDLDSSLFKVDFVAPPPSVQLHVLVQKFDLFHQKKQETTDIQSIIDEIAALKTAESYDWLRRTLASEAFGQSYADAYLNLCEGLKTDPSTENLQAVLKAVERGLVRPELLSSVFLDLTNIAVSVKQTRQLLDTLGSLAAIRAYGYDRSLTFRESFFYEKVDYLGKILSTPNAPHWIQRGALHDLLETHHPRLLFFLAAQVRLKPNDKDDYIKLLQKLTNNKITIQDVPTKNIVQEDAEIEKWKNYVRWWAIHAEDFEWDNTTERFLSRTEMTARTEEIERLVRRLGSSNDSVAVASFVQLTENDPSIVSSTIEKFRPLLRTYNTHLPEINYPFLENMTQLVAHCRARKICLRFPPHLDLLWTQLTLTDVPSKRYLIENQFIDVLTFKDVSALEYYGLLYSSDAQMNFSVSRILDIFYSKHWQQVISDNAALRLYLKKSVLFQRIGTAGTSSLYNRKMDKNDKTFRERLEKMIRTESDTDIRREILVWLNPQTSLKNEDFTEVKTPEKKHETIEQKIEILETAPEIQIEEINDFVAYPNFSELYKPLLIKFLKKIAPLSSIRHFKLKNYLKVSTDLAAFADMQIAPKDLDDFVGVFKIDDNSNSPNTEGVLWSFINTKTARYSIDERGAFWNSMFKVAWFSGFIYDGAMMPSQRDTILSTMRNYLTNSELLSEFEEQTTQTHIAELENIGRILTDKLASTLELDANNTIKTAVQSAILARVSYEDIGIVASFAERLNRNINDESPLRFLQTDFGLPIFSFDKETIEQLIINHKRLSPKAFYSFYLKQFGLDLWHTEGGLDYEKIYDILKHESVVAFTGGGTQRDYFTFGVIKLLEFEFDTRLGFHEKLNENQTFYTYNTSKRAAAWRQFLVEKKLVKLVPSVSPSFKS